MKRSDCLEVQAVYSYQSMYAVPDIEVRRAYVLRQSMIIVHKKKGEFVNDILVPFNRLEEGEQTGVFRMVKHFNQIVKAEMINYKIHDYGKPPEREEK